MNHKTLTLLAVICSIGVTCGTECFFRTDNNVFDGFLEICPNPFSGSHHESYCCDDTCCDVVEYLLSGTRLIIVVVIGALLIILAAYCCHYHIYRRSNGVVYNAPQSAYIIPTISGHYDNSRHQVFK